jgi:hypothetical protein
MGRTPVVSSALPKSVFEVEKLMCRDSSFFFIQDSKIQGRILVSEQMLSVQKVRFSGTPVRFSGSKVKLSGRTVRLSGRYCETFGETAILRHRKCEVFGEVIHRLSPY